MAAYDWVVFIVHPYRCPLSSARIEVPDVFERNGLWYMTCLTGLVYGNRGFWNDPNLVAGTIFAEKRRTPVPRGTPFHLRGFAGRNPRGKRDAGAIERHK